MVSIGMAKCKLGVEGAEALAELVWGIGSLTKVLVGYNSLGNEGATALCNALRESKVQELGLNSNGIGPDGAEAVASLCTVSASMTRIDVRFNRLDAKDEAKLRKAVDGRSGLELMLYSE